LDLRTSLALTSRTLDWHGHTRTHPEIPEGSSLLGHTSLRQIAAELNRLCIPGPWGREWSSAQVMRILKAAIPIRLNF
jgi:hypothetical protein